MQLPEDIQIDFASIVIKLLAVVAVLLFGRWLARRARVGLVKPLQRFVVTESMVTLIITLVYYGILVLSLALALAILGVPVNIILAVIGLFLIILAIALQQSLASLAATINFFLFKPFEVGHLLETCGVMGYVREIQLFSTVLIGNDYKVYVLPNAKIQSEGLTNYSVLGKIRMDMTFDISYSSNVGTAKDVLVKMLAEDGRVLPDPPATVYVKSLGDSSIELEIRPFISVDDYFRFQLDMPERVKAEFDAAGIVIPFPQTDVHLYPARAKPGGENSAVV